jgi:DNA ligase (NAD+)
MKKLNLTEAGVRADFLRKEIDRHNILYFQKDSPEIPDSEYDALLRELEDLEKEFPSLKTPDSPSVKVGAKPEKSLPPVEHTSPMLSLEKALNPDELREFEERVKRFLNSKDPIEYFVMPKFDGLAVELIFSRGKLTLASTRGDGRVGENVTANVLPIGDIPNTISQKSVPASLWEELKVRGEVYMEKAEFARINTERDEKGQQQFANPRNAAAGSLRRLEPKFDTEIALRFFAYGISDPDPGIFPSYSALMEKVLSWGFSVEHSSFTKKASDMDEVLRVFHSMEEKRAALPFEADGLVVNVNSLELWGRLGTTSRAPRYAVALKFKPMIAETRILSIEVQVGRTGSLTPVAVMEPVSVGGVTVSQATLHNFDELKRKDVREGDQVKIHRAGDVIPEILEVILDKRPEDSKPFVFNEKCPVCDTKAVRGEGEAVYRCPNKNCPAQIEERLIHFAHKNALDIEGLGPKLSKQLLSENLIKKPSDLFRLTKDVLKKIPRLGDKSADNLMASIDKARKADLWRFIHALSIRHVGERVSQLLADHYKSLKKLSEASEESLVAINEVGPEVAKSVVGFFQSPLNAAFIEDMLGDSLGISPTVGEAPKEGSVSGKKFVLTGTLPTLSRAEASARITAKGGRVLSSVSKETDYVVLGEAAGKKLEQAKKLGVATISEEELLKLLE